MKEEKPTVCRDERCRTDGWKCGWKCGGCKALDIALKKQVKEYEKKVELLKNEISTLPEDISARQFKIQMWHIIPEVFRKKVK